MLSLWPILTLAGSSDTPNSAREHFVHFTDQFGIVEHNLIVCIFNHNYKVLFLGYGERWSEVLGTGACVSLWRRQHLSTTFG